MEEAKELIKLAKPIKGIRPSFTTYHIYQVLESLYVDEPLGRPALLRRVRIGEASMKTLLRRLHDAGLIRSKKPEGTRLTGSGRKLIEKLIDKLVVVNHLTAEDICGGCSGAAVIARKDAAENILDFGVVQVRDEVVREGAYGAILLIYKRTLLLPTPQEMTNFEGFALEKELKALNILRDGDVVVVALCTSRTRLPCVSHAFDAVIRVIGENDC